MSTVAKATVSLHLDTTGIVEQLRGLADAIAAMTPNTEPAHRPPCVGGSVCGEPSHCPPESLPKPDLIGYTVHAVTMRAPHASCLHSYTFPTVAEAETAREAWAPNSGRVVEVREMSA